MKVAHLTKHINSGGIPVYIYTLGKVLRKMGVDQIIVSSGGSLEADFIRNGLPCYTFDLITKFEFHPKVFRALFPIIRTLKQEKVDLVHAHTRATQVLAAIIEKICGIPYVTTCHGFFKRRLGRKIFPAWGSRVIAISSLVKKDLIETHHISSDSIQLIKNGIEIEHFIQLSSPESQAQARAYWKIKPSDFAVCLVTRLVAEKGAADLLDAVKLLIKTHPNLKAFIAGDGKYRVTLENKAKELELTDHVTFTGNLFDVAPLLAACDAFVHPVRVQEGFGLSIAEAMASGRPVIVTDQWALWWIFKDKEIGACVKARCPSDIAAVLDHWIRNGNIAKQLGRNAQMEALKKFDINIMAESVAHVYKDVLDRKK